MDIFLIAGAIGLVWTAIKPSHLGVCIFTMMFFVAPIYYDLRIRTPYSNFLYFGPYDELLDKPGWIHQKMSLGESQCIAISLEKLLKLDCRA